MKKCINIIKFRVSILYNYFLIGPWQSLHSSSNSLRKNRCALKQLGIRCCQWSGYCYLLEWQTNNLATLSDKDSWMVSNQNPNKTIDGFFCCTNIRINNNVLAIFLRNNSLLQPFSRRLRLGSVKQAHILNAKTIYIFLFCIAIKLHKTKLKGLLFRNFYTLPLCI